MNRINLDEYNYFIFGSGLSGATFARKIITENPNAKILIFELRNHIGGNIYDYQSKEGILVHKYGPHIFHTNCDEIIEFIKKFATWELFRHKVNVKINDLEIPFPINFTSIDLLFPKEKENIKKSLIEEFKEKKQATIFELLNSKNEVIKKFGIYIYINVFDNYSRKMWGQDPINLDKNILKRVKINLSYDDGYFTDKFQAVPTKGYTEFIKKILDHKNIKIILNSNFDDLKIKDNRIYIYNKEITKPVIYTGLIDKLFNYKFGKLNYRSINFTFENLNVDSFQKRIVVNYPDDPKMTRITEYKKFPNTNSPRIKGITIIGKEFPGAYSENSKKFNIPCYPIYISNELENYKKYANESNKVENLFILGRLVEYKYKQMYQAIWDALKLNLKGKNK